MAGIIAVYALVVSVLIAGNIRPPPEKNYSLFEGFMHLACGLSVGLTGLAAGYAIGIVGDMVCRPHNYIPLHVYYLLTLNRAYDHTCNSPGYLLAWSSSSFSERFSVYMGTSSSLQQHHSSTDFSHLDLLSLSFSTPKLLASIFRDPAAKIPSLACQNFLRVG